MSTSLDIRGESFRINGRAVYAEMPGAPESVHGLLMNARFIQGIFDDRADPARFARFGWHEWDPERHTSELVAALPEWYAYGLRAITVGFQGGMPVFTIENETIDNNPFSADGSRIDEAYLRRMDSVIRAADALGMVVIVSLLYQGQSPRMRDGRTIRNAVSAGCRFLREGRYRNVIVEVANECNVGRFRERPLVCSSEGAASLIDWARTESGGLPVGCSMGGGDLSREICEASDVILIHGNGLSKQQYRTFVRSAKELGLDRPIVCNEDSPCASRLDVAFDSKTSWGYYNNLTKQEPPARWGVLPGEDLFFARRMARGLGIPVEPLDESEQYLFLGFEPEITFGGKRWLRVAAERPETIARVEFHRNGDMIDAAYEEPFFLLGENTWMQQGVETQRGDRWEAKVDLVDGRRVLLERQVP